MPRYKITTSTYLDNDDNDHIGTSVDYEMFGTPPTVEDFPSWHADLVATDCLVIERFDTEYDRSAEAYFPVRYVAFVDLHPENEED